tara:strand:+ start:2973 stop:3077 length:105 start_codon:yes stop_codon:yes gene_type:complete
MMEQEEIKKISDLKSVDEEEDKEEEEKEEEEEEK